jgi:hypothetical protein
MPAVPLGRRLTLVVTSGLLLAASLSSSVLAEPSTVLIAGDIAYGTSESGEDLTAALVSRHAGLVMTAGDNAYSNGTAAEFRDLYAPTWGAFRSRTRPTLGNHDYGTPGAAGYFGYFGWRAGPAGRGYYSIKVGAWRIYALDSEVCKQQTGCGPGDPQHTWLERHLARHAGRCTMAVFHTPLHSSGMHGDDRAVLPLVRLLYEAGAELIVNGHEHSYERLAPARPSGRIDTKTGVQQLIVGTGGAPLRARGPLAAPHSRVFSNDAWGVLRLRLRRDSYTWTFLPVAGETFTDRGERRCHGRPSHDGRP